jgi:peptidoglycan/LPS O-acetylase OafA/YrhL
MPKYSIHVSNLNQWMTGIAILVVTIIFSVPFTLMCETPFAKLEQVLLMPKKTTKKK